MTEDKTLYLGCKAIMVKAEILRAAFQACHDEQLQALHKLTNVATRKGGTLTEVKSKVTVAKAAMDTHFDNLVEEYATELTSLKAEVSSFIA